MDCRRGWLLQKLALSARRRPVRSCARRISVQLRAGPAVRRRIYDQLRSRPFFRLRQRRLDMGQGYFMVLCAVPVRPGRVQICQESLDFSRSRPAHYRRRLGGSYTWQDWKGAFDILYGSGLHSGFRQHQDRASSTLPSICLCSEI